MDYVNLQVGLCFIKWRSNELRETQQCSDHKCALNEEAILKYYSIDADPYNEHCITWSEYQI